MNLNANKTGTLLIGILNSEGISKPYCPHADTIALEMRFSIAF